MSPPHDSTASAISAAWRVSVPLNNRCSRKWLVPAIASGSSRDPVPTQNPTAAERRPGRCSVTTRNPESSRVPRMPDASSTIGAVIDAWRSRLDRHPRNSGAVGQRRPPRRRPPPPRRSPRSPPPGRPTSAGPRSPNSARACESQASSNDATSTSPLPPLTVRSPRRPVAVAPGLALTAPGVGRTARLGLVPRQRERELARVVDVVDADGDLVAEVEDVLDLVDALAAAELGDVEQAVTAGQDVDERPELGDVHDLARCTRPRARRWAGRGSARSAAAPLRRPRRPWSRC